jgi:NADPH2:quinone reductase
MWTLDAGLNSGAEVGVRAVWMRAVGGPEVLSVGEAPDPVPGAGQVLVEVEVAGITFIETLVRAGVFTPPGPPIELPRIPGNAVGGVVRAVGDGADPALYGQRVITGTGGTGGYAELAVADAAGVIRVPAGLDLATATALLADGRTAVGLIRAGEPGPGEWVLVEAAAGGLGTLLVQLASNAGARVIGAASSDRKLALARELGAAGVVDYTSPDWPSQVQQITGGNGPDLVYDGVGGEIGQAAASLVRPGGRFVQHGLASGRPTDTGAARSRGVLVTGMDVLRTMASPELVSTALAEAAAGRLRPVIGQTFPLAEAAQAHAAIEARTALGKTLLTV